METKKGGWFNSFFDIDKDVRLESAGDTYINTTGENLYLGGSNYLKVFILYNFLQILYLYMNKYFLRRLYVKRKRNI